ncbi:MAG TPA: ATP-binding cassette domain-containing protein [Devosia sp.]|nr:ATP-binding cassette domain-containing protein [Devosia sp.]
MSDTPLISVRDLSVHFGVRGGGLGKKPVVRAVEGVDLDIEKGSFFGLVGESGSGKTTLGRALLRAVPITRGDLTYDDGEKQYDLAAIEKADLKDYRTRAQLIFQDPYAALSPRMTVRDIIAEPLEVMGITASKAETDERVREIAAKCRLNLEHLRRFPHAFSGGQRQRISIARALVSRPRFVVADESVAALDVSIQADVLNLLKDIQQEMGLTFLFISHDLSVVAHVCDHVAVMYLGRLVETAPTRELFANPRHPYTRALLSAIPSLDPDDDSVVDKLEGEIPSPTNPPPGCKFQTRCRFAVDRCRTEEPILDHAAHQHNVACHRWQELVEVFEAEDAAAKERSDKRHAAAGKAMAKGKAASGAGASSTAKTRGKAKPKSKGKSKDK